ncbi:MAG: methionyl-tRNA formyltransferase [Verrucomicrobia bacterium]|nr:methionyl-tRNA formyltransferase [Verrucomicrobiota bacterium]
MSTPSPVVFFGTSPLAVVSLKSLLESPLVSVRAVVTQPDRPQGRTMKLAPPPVKTEALIHDLPVLQPERCRSPDFLPQLSEFQPELIVVAAYGQILPPGILTLPIHGCLNVHASLLPRYRGASPIQWAILNGDAESGVTIMQMDAGMDTGDILTQESTPIEESDTAQTLHDRLAAIGGTLLVRTIQGLLEGSVHPRKQDGSLATHASKIAKSDGLVDWSQSAVAIRNRVRAFTPWPGAFTTLPAPSGSKTIKLLQVEPAPPMQAPPGMTHSPTRGEWVLACGDGALRIVKLQMEGRRAMTPAEFLAGHPLPDGTRLG